MLPVWWKLSLFYFLSAILWFQNGFSGFWVISATKTVIFYSKFHDLSEMVTVLTEITENSGLCGYFFGLYHAAEAQNHPEIARFVRFRQRRCGFKKIRSKIIIFSPRYRLLKINKQSAFFLTKKKHFQHAKWFWSLRGTFLHFGTTLGT